MVDNHLLTLTDEDLAIAFAQSARIFTEYVDLDEPAAAAMTLTNIDAILDECNRRGIWVCERRARR